VKNGDTILLFFSIANRQRRGVLPAHGTAFFLCEGLATMDTTRYWFSIVR
jgi:hypothetical protein